MQSTSVTITDSSDFCIATKIEKQDTCRILYDMHWGTCIDEIAINAAEKIFIETKAAVEESLQGLNKRYVINDPYEKEWKFSFYDIVALKGNLNGCYSSEHILHDWLTETEGKNIYHRALSTSSSSLSLSPIKSGRKVTAIDGDYLDEKMLQLCSKIAVIIEEKFIAFQKEPGNEYYSFGIAKEERMPRVTVRGWIAELKASKSSTSSSSSSSRSAPMGHSTSVYAVQNIAKSKKWGFGVF